MISEMRLPSAEKEEERKGGQASLRELLDTINRTGFTGYLRTVLTLDGDSSNGVLVFDQGAPTVALYSFKPAGNNSVEMMYRGERAAEFTLGDSIFPDTSISLMRVGDRNALSSLIEDHRQDRAPVDVDAPGEGPGQGEGRAVQLLEDRLEPQEQRVALGVRSAELPQAERLEVGLRAVLIAPEGRRAAYALERPLPATIASFGRNPVRYTLNDRVAHRHTHRRPPGTGPILYRRRPAGKRRPAGYFGSGTVFFS